MDNAAVEKAYLEELEELEKFRILHTGQHPRVPLGREDPDVRRLIEALAFFSARTRIAAERTVNESLLRIFRQHFPYALAPMPAMVMLRAQPSPVGFVDAVELPRGSEVLVSRRVTRDPSVAPVQYRFRTTAPLRLLPIRLGDVFVTDLSRGKEKGARITLRFASQFKQGEIGELSLHLNHLNDLFASMAIMLAFKRSLVRASVVYGEGTPGEEGAPCDVSFGAPAAGADEGAAFEHPDQRFRAALHFPQAEQFVRVRVPPPKEKWQTFSLRFDMSPEWPLDYSLTNDTFDLNVVPMMNLQQEMANPLECDGTKERYPVRHPEEAQGFVPHSILGVYRMTDQGMIPLEPGVVGPTEGGFETVFEGQDRDRRAWVILDLPTAFDQPEKIAIEAFWTQPEITGAQAHELGVRLATRHIDQVTWGCSGTLVPLAGNELESDRDGLLKMVSYKSMRFLDLEALTFLAFALGAGRRPEFSRITAALDEVKIEARPAARKAGGVSNVYELRFDRRVTRDLLPWLDLFCRSLLGLLEAWSAQQVVEIVARVPSLDREQPCVLRYPD
jgi:type VI secretion system protein ImpG